VCFILLGNRELPKQRRRHARGGGGGGDFEWCPESLLLLPEPGRGPPARTNSRPSCTSNPSHHRPPGLLPSDEALRRQPTVGEDRWIYSLDDGRERSLGIPRHTMHRDTAMRAQEVGRGRGSGKEGGGGGRGERGREGQILGLQLTTTRSCCRALLRPCSRALLRHCSCNLLTPVLAVSASFLGEEQGLGGIGGGWGGGAKP
jgi:hypothetical protein